MAPLNDDWLKMKRKLRLLLTVASVFLLLFGATPVWAAPSPCVGAKSIATTPLGVQVYAVTSARLLHTPQMPANDPCCHGGLVCATCSGVPLGGIPIALRFELPATEAGISYLARSFMVPRGFSVRPYLPPPRASV